MNLEQAEGVTQSTEVSQPSAEDSTPESIESTGAPENEAGSEDSAVTEQPKSKEYNFKQMRESIARLEAEKNGWDAERQKLQAASQLDQWLRKDPKAALKFISKTLKVDPRSLIEEVEQAQSQKSEMPQIDFEQYDPETAKLLKFMHERASKVDQLEQWKNQFEQKQSQTEEQRVQNELTKNMATLDDEFNKQLSANGFIDKEGNGEPQVISLMEKTALSVLAEMVDDPRQASREQVQEAFKKVMEMTSAFQKQTLKKTVKVDVPPSGSRKGTIPVGKTRLTEDERISSIVNELS